MMAPVWLRRVASGLMIDRVRSTAILHSNSRKARALCRGKSHDTSPAAMLVLDNIVVRFGGREILKGASASLPAGRRVGLVGRNGAGKSTLLKLILGQLHADVGETRVPAAWRIGSVAQEAPSGDSNLIDTVLAADT